MKQYMYYRKTAKASAHLTLPSTWDSAGNIYERHIILTKMLTMIGVDEETAAADACKMEHYISEKSFNAIKEHMQKHPAKP